MNPRKCYTAAEKLLVVKYAEVEGNRAASRQFSINESNIRSWRKNKEALRMSSSKKKANRGSSPGFPELDKKLLEWVIEKRQQGHYVSYLEIRIKALELEKSITGKTEFKASYGWAVRFMKRNGMAVAESDAKVNMEMEREYIAKEEARVEDCDQEMMDTESQENISANIHCEIDIKVEEICVKTEYPDCEVDTPPDEYNIREFKEDDNDEEKYLSEDRNTNVEPVDISQHLCVTIKEEPTEWSSVHPKPNVEPCERDSKRTAARACDVCHKHFSTLGKLNAHIKIHSNEKAYSCDMCEKRYSTIYSLKYHKRNHTGEKPHVCNICNKAFIHPSYLSAHKLIHSSVKSFMCDICNKSFNRLAHLNQHKIIHSGEKPHICEVCNRAFSRLHTLTQHKLIHTGDKPYVCEVCNKAFTHSSSLTGHRFIHTRQKPYVCNVCNKTFSLSSNLAEHNLIHTGEKPYVCDVCNKAFRHSSTLNAHKITHTGEKPYECDICSKAYTRMSSLTLHMEIHS